MILIILLTKVILPRKDVLDFVLVDIWGLYCWDSKLGKLKHLWEKLYALLWPYTNTGCIIHCTVNTCSFMSEWSGLMIIPTAASEYVSGTMNMQRDFPAPVGIWTKVPFPWRARSIDSSWPGRKFIKPNTAYWKQHNMNHSPRLIANLCSVGTYYYVQTPVAPITISELQRNCFAKFERITIDTIPSKRTISFVCVCKQRCCSWRIVCT